MRQIFTSQRLENVEKVAQIMRDAGIEVSISNGRSYKGGRRRSFSYRDSGSGSQPSLWVVHSEDQPRARELMREQGLPTGPTTRPLPEGYLPAARTPAPQPPSARQDITRYRRILLIGIAILAALVLMRSL